MIELATHLEEKAARLKHEGLGKIKIALAGCKCILAYQYTRGSLWFHRPRDYLPSFHPQNQRNSYGRFPSTPSPTDGGPVEVELVFPT